MSVALSSLLAALGEYVLPGYGPLMGGLIGSIVGGCIGNQFLDPLIRQQINGTEFVKEHYRGETSEAIYEAALGHLNLHRDSTVAEIKMIRRTYLMTHHADRLNDLNLNGTEELDEITKRLISLECSYQLIVSYLKACGRWKD